MNEKAIIMVGPGPGSVDMAMVRHLADKKGVEVILVDVKTVSQDPFSNAKPFKFDRLPDVIQHMPHEPKFRRASQRNNKWKYR